MVYSVTYQFCGLFVITLLYHLSDLEMVYIFAVGATLIRFSPFCGCLIATQYRCERYLDKNAAHSGFIRFTAYAPIGNFRTKLSEMRSNKKAIWSNFGVKL